MMAMVERLLYWLLEGVLRCLGYREEEESP